VCATGAELADLWVPVRRVARRPRPCDECGAPIPAGRAYFRIGVLFEGRWDTLWVHVECAALWEQVRWQLCGGHGGPLIGGLSEEIADSIEPIARLFRWKYDRIRESYAAGLPR